MPVPLLGVGVPASCLPKLREPGEAKAVVVHTASTLGGRCAGRLVAASPRSTVDDVHAASRLRGLPELTEVRKVWFSDWYDGPITGIALRDGREYWFVMVTNDDHGGHWDFEPRVYLPCPIAGAPSAEMSAALRSLASWG
jgi:hypothetical protein